MRYPPDCHLKIHYNRALVIKYAGLFYVFNTILFFNIKNVYVTLVLFLQEFIYHGAGFVFLLIASVFLLLDANDSTGRNPNNHFVVASVST